MPPLLTTFRGPGRRRRFQFCIFRFQSVRRLFLQLFSRGLLARRIRRPWPLSRRRLRDSFPVLSDFKGLRGGKFPIGLPALRIRELWPLGRRRRSETIRRNARSAARPRTRCCRFEASEPIPFPGADSIFSRRCGAISGRPPFCRQPLPPRSARRWPLSRFLSSKYQKASDHT